MSTSGRGKTGLEWLLEKHQPEKPSPPAEKGSDPPIPVPPSEVAPEPWQVQQVSEIRAPVPAKILALEPVTAPIAPAETDVPVRKAERREHPRARVNMEVRYKKGSEAVVGRGVYLSLSGFYVAAEQRLPAGEVFQAQLVFPEKGNKRLAVIAEVIWDSEVEPRKTADLPPGEALPGGMGAKFLDVDDSDLPFLKELIEAALKAG